MVKKIPYKKSEIDKKAASKLSQEILGNEVIRHLICDRAKEDLSDTNIVYDHSNKRFDDKITSSINYKYQQEEAQLFVDFVSSMRSINNRIPYKANEVRMHVDNLLLENSGLRR